MGVVPCPALLAPPVDGFQTVRIILLTDSVVICFVPIFAAGASIRILGLTVLIHALSGLEVQSKFACKAFSILDVVPLAKI